MCYTCTKNKLMKIGKINTDKKVLYNTDQSDECSKWLRETNKGKKTIDNIIGYIHVLMFTYVIISSYI